jgi:hypothetical protein
MPGIKGFSANNFFLIHLADKGIFQYVYNHKKSYPLDGTKV